MGEVHRRDSSINERNWRTFNNALTSSRSQPFLLLGLANSRRTLDSHLQVFWDCREISFPAVEKRSSTGCLVSQEDLFIPPVHSSKSPDFGCFLDEQEILHQGNSLSFEPQGLLRLGSFLRWTGWTKIFKNLKIFLCYDSGINKGRPF